MCERSQDPDLKTFVICGRRSSTMSSLYPVPRGGAADALPNQRLLETGVSPVHGCKRTGRSTRFLAGRTPGAHAVYHGSPRPGARVVAYVRKSPRLPAKAGLWMGRLRTTAVAPPMVVLRAPAP